MAPAHAEALKRFGTPYRTAVVGDQIIRPFITGEAFQPRRDLAPGRLREIETNHHCRFHCRSPLSNRSSLVERPQHEERPLTSVLRRYQRHRVK